MRRGATARIRRALLGVVLVALLGGPLAACTAPPPARRDVVIGLSGEPTSIFGGEPAALVLAAAVTEELVRRNERDEYVPRLAVEVPTLGNGALRIVLDDPTAPTGRLVATFRLRANLRWHDGAPLTTDDVAFAWQHERTLPPGLPARFLADRVDRVEVLTDRVVRFHYRAGERWDGYPLAARVLPRHRLAGATAAQWAVYERELMHAGPFAVAAWLPGYGVTLSAFPGYALGAPGLGRLEVRFYPDRAAVVEALRRGEVDVVPSPVFEADLVRTLDGIADGSDRSRLQAFYTAGEAVEMLHFATRGERFGDVLVRRAVELAVNRQAIVDLLLAGRARVPRDYLVPPLWAATVSGQVARPDRDAARALLARAGYTRGAFGVLERGAQRMVLLLLVAAGSPVRIDAARLVAGDLAAVGIAVEVRERPLSELLATLRRGDWDLALLARPADDPLAASLPWLGLSDPWFDLVVGAAGTAPDRAEQRLAWAEAQRLWAADLPGLPLYQRLAVDVAPRGLDGIRPAPGGAALTWNVAQWRFAAP